MDWIYGVLKSYGLFSSMPIAAAAAAVYAVIRAIYLRCSGKPRAAWLSEIARCLLVWYLVTLIVLVWFPEFPRLVFGEISIEDFAALTFQPGEYANNKRFWALFHGDLSVLKDEELVGNIIMFLPYGILLSIGFHKLKWWTVDFIGLGTTVLIELLQPFLERSCDLDDIIANTLGAIVGCAAAKLFVTLFYRENKRVCQYDSRSNFDQ